MAIVDPFLPGQIVCRGGRFLAIVPPRQITSLRHVVWEHPDFPTERSLLGREGVLPASSEELESSFAMFRSSRDSSEKWMREWAVRHMSEDFSEDAAFTYAIRAGENMHVGPYEDAREHIDSEWWGHWERITGKTRPDDFGGSYFSCSC